MKISDLWIWAVECKGTSSSLWNAEQHCPLGWVETKSLGMIKPCNLVRLNKCKISLIKNLKQQPKQYMSQTSSCHSQIGSQLLGKKKKKPQILYQMLSLFPLK
jgi:hypothetical protein